jgi:aryl-alcohol dehydrogenase-like predicted oxidoreductase
MNGQALLHYTELGNTSIKISPIGIGIWSWGGRFFWGYGRNYTFEDLKEAFELILDAGINFIDTAEVYGAGKSEIILGNLIKSKQHSLVVATKFFPFPWRIDPKSAKRAIRNSIQRLHIDQVDLYQIHMPTPPYPIEFWLRKLAEVQQAGYTKAIGVSNYNLDQTRRAHEFLANLGLPLASNQVRYSLIDRDIEHNGVLDYCHKNNIAVIAYSPLAMGMLTGKYTPEKPPKGVRRSAYRYTPDFLSKIQPTLELMLEIGQGHGGKTPAQVAINWALCKGTIPIPGVKNARQAKENIDSTKWRLNPEEIRILDKSTANFRRRL